MPRTYRAQQLEVLEAVQHLARPLLPRGVVNGGIECRAEAAKGAQVAAVTLRAVAAAVEAVEQQAVEGTVLFVLQGGLCTSGGGAASRLRAAWES